MDPSLYSTIIIEQNRRIFKQSHNKNHIIYNPYFNFDWLSVQEN